MTHSEITQDEIQQEVKKQKKGKAPGPDGIPAELLKTLAKEAPIFLGKMYNSIPCEWKNVKVVLIEKPKKDSRRYTIIQANMSNKHYG